MKEILLTDGSVTVVDDEDFERFGHFTWYNTGGYATRWDPVAKKYFWLHLEILGNPIGLVGDHIDRHPANNVRSNLRAVTKSEDLKNRAPFVRGPALKPLDIFQDRYQATPLVAAVIEEQGRRKTWMAEQIQVTNSQVSHVLAGRRTVVESDARIWANILGVPFGALWKLAKTSKKLRTEDSFTEPEAA